MQLLSGTILSNGRYVIKSCIGDGGFGITYLAEDNRLDREIVIKEYFPDYMAIRDVSVSNTVRTIDATRSEELHNGIEKFMKEAKTLARLNDIQAIADVYDFFEENNTAYIVMEYIKGKNLRQYIKERTIPYSYDEAMKILSPCMFALQKVHEAGIIHRDFAPDNIIIDNKGIAKIIDFGASRDFVANNATMTVMVKHGYAPIEQYSNAVKQGPYTDVYSIGAILYEMLTLNKPMPSIDRVIADNLIVPSSVNTSVTPVQDSIVMKALAVVYSSRYQTVQDFSDALRESEDQVAVMPQISQPVNNSAAIYSENKADALIDFEPTELLGAGNAGLGNFEATELLGLGSERFVDSEATELVSGTSQQNYQQISYTPKEKKSKNGIIIGAACAIAAVLVIGIIGIVLVKNGFKSSNTAINNIADASVGDTITFGDYNGNTEWIVLDKADGKILVLSKYVVAKEPYNTDSVSVTWESCTLRSWLNDEYFVTAFNSQERSRIVETTVDNSNCTVLGMDNGNDTIDKVFLLSLNEAGKYLHSDTPIIATLSNGTVAWWWLRTLGNYDKFAMAVSSVGAVNGNGNMIHDGTGGVRPAMWIDISDL